jgi:thioredoxin reductase/NAD-dependent dihydropyrimidine dehydrogenase PreA subunit
MIPLLARYANWLHLQWPAGGVEKLPVAGTGGRTNVPGVFVCGDLTGVPLLKFALDSGVRAVRAIAADAQGRGKPANTDLVDVVILGGGVAGMAAAIEAKLQGLSFEVIEGTAPFATVADFPRGKPIFTYPMDLLPQGALQVRATVKEQLLDELRAQVERVGVPVTHARAERVVREGGALTVKLEGGGTRRARAVLIAIGRSGDFRRLGVPGESLDHVHVRLHDPADHAGRDVLVVGGGDSALEAASALAEAGARVTLAHRGADFSRARAENAERVQALASRGALALRLRTSVREITATDAELADGAGEIARVPAQSVFTFLGREAPLAFLRRCGIRIAGDGSRAGWAAIACFLVALAALYDWKSNGFLEQALWSHLTWPGDAPQRLASLGSWWEAQVADRATLVGTIAVSMKSRSFWYTLAYTSIVGLFGWQRVTVTPTPYVKKQTLTLFLVQAIPLFILPEIVLPWLGYRGAFDSGVGATIGDALFEKYVSAADYAARHWPDWGHPRAYWRAYGFVLAWPLNVYNIFTEQPIWPWIAIGFLQTFVLLPLAIRRWGKGVYCGWICSCGALAETLGDAQRTKMPHGPKWNRLNFVGQVFLAFAFALLALRVVSWAFPATGLGSVFTLLMEGKDAQHRLVNPLSYKWFVDVLFGGVLGVGFYFKYSGRVWCRFACPLAALMHIYARFSRFAIVPEKKKCISCNVCTSVCHQGIDVMSFANKGRPMQDPECVRCSACVNACPTGVLQFGQVGTDGSIVSLDSLMASPVRAKETR